MASGRRVAGSIRYLVNARGLRLECFRVLYESFLSETLIWKENERYRIRAVQIDKLRGLLGIRRMDKVPNARIRELCGVTKGLMKVFSDGSAMRREWRMTGLLRGSIWGCAGSSSLGYGRGGLIP